MKLALVLLLLCAVPVHASTITFTSGSAWIDGNQASWDNCFATTGINPTCKFVPALSPLDGVTALRNHVPRVTIDGALYLGPAPTTFNPFPDNLLMSFAYNAIPAAEPSFEDVYTSPFTMTGTLALFQEGHPVTFYVAGQGTLERYWRPVLGTPFLHVQFNFEPAPVYVPEPASALLVGLGLAALCFLRRNHATQTPARTAAR